MRIWERSQLQRICLRTGARGVELGSLELEVLPCSQFWLPEGLRDISVLGVFALLCFGLDHDSGDRKNCSVTVSLLHIPFVAAQACPDSHLWTTGPLSLIEHLGFRLRDAIHEQWMRLVVQLRSPVHVLDGYLEVASSLAVSFRTDDLFFVGSKSSLCLRH